MSESEVKVSMFKYVWLIMIVFVVGVFVAYTIYCCYQESKDAASLQDWYDNMVMDHEGLVTGWAAIFIFAVLILFVSSLVTFSSSSMG